MTKFDRLPAAGVRAPMPAILLVGLLLALGAAAAPLRVVSLAPSLSELVHALGAGELLVGRSRYCRHPPALLELPEVGGYLDLGWEFLLALEPDLVLLTPEHGDVLQRLEILGVPALALPQNRLDELLEGCRIVGGALGRQEEGRRLAAALEDSLAAARERALQRSAPAPRVLWIAGREPGPGPPRGLWAIGSGSWLAELLSVVGARNAIDDPRPALPGLSRERLLQLDPDWILELAPQPEAGRSTAQRRADWERLPELGAVAAGRVVLLEDEAFVVPGPRLPRALRQLEALLQADLPQEER
jgi:iron complex transport system substrate-binding protein